MDVLGPFLALLRDETEREVGILVEEDVGLRSGRHRLEPGDFPAGCNEEVGDLFTACAGGGGRETEAERQRSERGQEHW